MFRNLYEQHPSKACGRKVVHGDCYYRKYCAADACLHFPQQNELMRLFQLSVLF